MTIESTVSAFRTLVESEIAEYEDGAIIPQELLELRRLVLQNQSSGVLPIVNDRLRTDSLVKTMLRKLRDDFPGTAINPAMWTVLQTGAGQSITLSTSELRLAAGTTANSETIIRSVESFTIPFRTTFIVNLSQRIANQEVFLEITDASGQNFASWEFDGTASTSIKYLSGNGGESSAPLSASTTTTTAYQVYEIEATPDELYYYAKAANSSTSRGGLGVRNRLVPDPNLEYFVQLRVKNLGTAPASNTTVNIDAITVQDIEELTAEITGGRGGGAANQAIPIMAPSSIPVSSTAGALNVNDSFTTTVETTTNLAANGIYAGTSRDSLGGRNSVRGWVFTDVNGTLIFEQSHNNTTFRQTDSVAIAGSTTQASRYEFKLVTRYFRIRYVNGTTAQTTLEIISSPFNIGA